MAAGNATLTSEVQTIETSTSVFTMTKKAGQAGLLINGGANKVYITLTGNTPAANDTGQIVGEIGVDRVQLGNPGIRIPKRATTIKFTSTVGASVLYWIPDE